MAETVAATTIVVAAPCFRLSLSSPPATACWGQGYLGGPRAHFCCCPRCGHGGPEPGQWRVARFPSLLTVNWSTALNCMRRRGAGSSYSAGGLWGGETTSAGGGIGLGVCRSGAAPGPAWARRAGENSLPPSDLEFTVQAPGIAREQRAPCSGAAGWSGLRRELSRHAPCLLLAPTLIWGPCYRS